MRWLSLLLLLLAACSGQPVWRGAPPPEEVEGLAAPELVAFSPNDDLSASLSPDGRYLVYASEQNGNLDVWVRDFGTNSNYPLSIDSPTDDWDPEVGPDGKAVVFASRRNDAKGDLFLVQGFGSEADPIRLTDERTADRQPRFSPLGGKLYFTSASGVGFEFITELDLETKERRRVSATPGFDPAVSPDGRYMVYTAPAGEGGRESPHLVAMRMADSATRAVTQAVAPEGFARFVPGEQYALVYVRFADDDDGDGARDANDNASLWRLDLDLDELFEGRTEAARPFPLTDGSDDELFPLVSSGALYFTQGTAQQDILRLPVGGMFPRYEDPARYFDLAKTFDEPRKRWFAYRCALARAEPGEDLYADALLRIGNLHLERGRDDLAREAYLELSRVTVQAAPGSARAELRGLALAELVSIDRTEAIGEAATPVAREAVLTAIFGRLEDLAAEYADEKRVVARVELEMAEVILDRKDRTRAIRAFEQVTEQHADQSFSAARAMLRRTELLGVAHDPGAVGEAYAQVLARYPDQREVVREASRRIVEVHVSALRRGRSFRELVDELRRLVTRYGASPVSLEGRRRLTEILRENGALADAALELEQLAAEAKGQGDRLGAARAQQELAEVEEALGRFDAASLAWRELRSGYGDLPGVASAAREAITRVNLARAAVEERRGNAEAARSAYHDVIDNDLSQVEAHRRYLALSARVGKLGEALDEARGRAEASPGTPIARYAYGLALTWLEPPELGRAKEEIERAIELNPQFVHAYITRGWIAEMQHVAGKSTLDDFVEGVADVINFVIGEILDIEIDTEGLLEEAIENYKTALRLNQESLFRETEAEILINLGNAHYRLGDVTRDASNFRIAFERYLDALRLDYRFKNRLTEMAYFERFGRAAAWSEEWALSAMATRRAIRTAEELGDERRLTQLYGNLALAYHQAGEEAYAKDALARYGARLEETKSLERLLIARRERARARIGTLEGRGAEVLDSVLVDLADAREDLVDLGEIDRELPSVWLPVTTNLSSAVYGFQTHAERDLNLALAEQAHRAHGEVSRAEAIRRLRLGVTEEALDSVPGAFAGLGRKWPITLLMVRERVGLRVSSAVDAYERGDAEAGDQTLREALEELDRFLEEDTLAEDRPMLLLDRARVVALQIEWSAAAGRPSAGAAEIDLMLQQIEEVAGATTTTTLARLPDALTSTGAVTLTASIARGHPWLAGIASRASAVRARLHHARGLSLVAEAHQAAGGASSIGALISSLDSARDRLVEARAAFRKAALAAAGGGHGLGMRMLALSLMSLSEVERSLRGSPGLIRVLQGAARSVAELNGDLGLATAIAVAGHLRGGELAAAKDALMTVPPQVMHGHSGLVEALFSATASAALARGDAEAALVALDRSLVYRRAIGPAIDYANLREPKERAVSQKLALHLERLRAAQRDLSWTDALTDANQLAQARRRVADDVASLRALLQEEADDLSPEGAMRLFGRPLDATLIQYELAPDEGVLLAAPVEGMVHLILIDGSTTTEEKYVHRSTGVPIDEARRDLTLLREALEAGTRDEALIQRVRATLFAPLSGALERKARLMVATAELGGPIPQVALPRGLDGPALAHLSAPSLLELVRGAQLVGVDGALVLSSDDSKRLAEAGRRLVGEQVYGFRTGPSEIPLEPGQQRGLDERSPVEELFGRASDTVVVEAEVRLEPAALERSAILLERRPIPRTEEEIEEQRARAPDAFRAEVPLAALALPARVLVLARVSERSFGLPERRVPPASTIRLDLTMLSRGVGTTVLIPASVPDEAARALLGRFMALQREHGAADALRRAQADVAERWPSVLSASLVGAPGLDAQSSRSFAANLVKSAGGRAAGHFKARRYREAVEAIKQWIRLQHASGKAGAVKFAYDALVGILAEHLTPPQPARAADYQKALVDYLEGELKKARGKAKKKLEGELFESRLLLGRLYSRAQDFEQAEKTFEAVVGELKQKRDRISLGSALHEYALHKKRMLDEEAAALLMEEAITTYQRAGAYEMKKRPRDAEAAVLEVAAIYLNRLSDPERAKRAFSRALSMARTDVGRINIEIGLARAARRSGDFDEASEHAARAREQAMAKKLDELALSALIEAANVSWYRGDYRRGTELCQQSLAEVDQLLELLRKDLTSGNKKKVRESLAQRRRELKRLQIYALSVCGLTAMSQRDFDAASGHLERARRVAESIGDEREVATQYNNLGRVYLEFGRLADAIEAFRAAEKIDRRLDDRYALAYDLRNLGRALSLVKRRKEAKSALETALRYSVEVKDKNNELRARFALGELFLEQGRTKEARRHYLDALPLAKDLEVAELSWQIHRALGLMLRHEGDLEAAEVELRKAIDIVRSITGRAASSDFGPHRYAAFDDLITLLLDRDRPEEAFRVAEHARVLELSELAEDSRIDIGGPEVGALWRAAKAARTATAAASALRELERVRPRLARLLETSDLEGLSAEVPPDGVVLVYRVTDAEVITFAVREDGVTAGRAPIGRSDFTSLVEDYGRQMAARADVTVASRRIAELTLAPVMGRLADKQRIAVVPHGPLRYVAFAALPLPNGEAVIDRFAILSALGPKSAASGLARPFTGLEKAPIVALGAGTATPGRADPPLPFARKELEVIREEYPKAALVSGDALTKGTFLSALEDARGVFHFAGHSYLAGDGAGRFVDPLGGRLRTADGSVSMLEVLSSSTDAELVVLSACHTMLGPEGGRRASGDELRSLAQAFRFAGARWIVATSMHVHDLAASLVMKRFYRALRDDDVMTALQEAQRQVRALYPHPAWWATFSILI